MAPGPLPHCSLGPDETKFSNQHKTLNSLTSSKWLGARALVF